MPRLLIAGNWKMNTTYAEAVSLTRDVRTGVEAVDGDGTGGVEAVVCPPAISLAAVSDALAGSPVKVGAQNIHHEDAGAFTGEISPAMLAGFCEYVILGHSERRQLFGEDDGRVNLKTLAALRHGLRPILCVGETLDERESGQAGKVVERQVREGLTGVVDISSLVVAYEPVWAIGTGRAATPEIASEIMGESIQATLEAMFGQAGAETRLLYGGSVNPSNVVGYMEQAPIHGALVGGASLKAEQFVEIIRLASAAKARR